MVFNFLPYLGGRCHPGEQYVHSLRPGSCGSAVWEGRSPAESSGALHWPVWHQTGRGPHPPAQPRGTVHSLLELLYPDRYCIIRIAFIRMKWLLNVDGCVMAISVLWELLCYDWCGNILCSGCSGWWTSSALCRWRTLWSVWEPCFLLTSGRTSRSAFRWPPSITSSSPPRHSQSSSSPSRALRVRMLKTHSVHHNWFSRN